MALSQNLNGAALGLLAFGAYAAYDISAKFLGEGIHPLQIIAAAGLFHLPILLAYAWWQRGSLWPKAPKLMALRAVGTVVNFIAGVSAFTMLPLAEAYVIFFTMPLMIAVLAIPVLGERLDPIRGLAVLLGLVGVVVALDPTTTPLNFGHALAFTGASVGAMNYVLIRKTGAIERTPVMLLWPQLVLVPLVCAATPFVYVPMDARDLAVAAFMAVILFVGAMAIIAAYRRAAAVIVAPMQYSQIGWAAVFSALLFHEPMTRSILLGCLLIAVAGTMVVVRQDRPAIKPAGQTP